MKKYSFKEDEIEGIKKKLKIDKNDAFILIVGNEKQVGIAYNAIKKRIKDFSKGIPMEVRQSNSDATTTFLRPMPGAARMYPETDCQLLTIKKSLIDKIKNNLPKLASENKRYLQDFGVNDELIKLLLKEGKTEEFKDLTSLTDHYELVAKCLTLFPKEISKRESLSRELVDEKLNSDILSLILEQVPDLISANDVKSILHKIVQGKTFDEATKKTEIHLSEEIKKILEEKPGLSRGAYMGLLMNKFSGLVNGKEVNDELDKILD